jgi:hypothetical protein
MNEKPELPGSTTPSSKIEAIPSMGDERRGVGDDAQQSFSSLMQPKETDVTKMAPKVSNVSPFDLAHMGIKPIGSPNVNTLIEQTDLLHGSFNTVQNQLSYPNLKLKSSQKYLVKNKLTDVNAHLRAANAKLGISPSEAPPEMKGAGPIAQYLGYITDGMNQLDSAKKQLGAISAQGSNVNPAEYMLLQLKFNKAQQELDFTSTVLAKSIEGMKTIMNIQI